MGCCSSREAASSDPPPAPVSATPHRSNEDLQGADGEDVVQAVSGSRLDGTHGSSISGRPNASLRPPKAWRSTSRTWTRQQLAREREIFWETQVTGSHQIWAALRLAIDMMRGDSDGQARSSPDLKGAKAVLDASGCTCPTGRLGEGVWDEQGRLYKLPRWVISDPVNMIEGPPVDDDDEEVAEDDDVEEDDETKEGGDDLYASGIVEKGKELTPVSSNAVALTTRLSDRGTDVKINVDLGQAVRSVVKRVQTEAGIDPGVKVKLAYMGKVLKDNESLSAQGWQTGHVVNALVFNV